MHVGKVTFAVVCGCLLGATSLSRVVAEETELPEVFVDDFESGADRWMPTDAAAWKVTRTEKGHVYDQFQKRSQYEPPYRSPYNMSLVKDLRVEDFVLQTRVLSTHPDYGHRDVCLFFGYQDPAHFYYVHLGKQADDHANQIFIVNGKARTKISLKSTPGTNWDDAWHQVKIVRKVSCCARTVIGTSGPRPTSSIDFSSSSTLILQASARKFATSFNGLSSQSRSNRLASAARTCSPSSSSKSTDGLGTLSGFCSRIRRTARYLSSRA